MQITCQQCGEPIRADDVNIQAAVAKCDACQAVFNIGGQTPPAKAPVEMPKRFDVEELPDRMKITHRWSRLTAIPLGLFAVVWNGFLVFWYSMAFGDPNAPLFMKLFPLGHVAVGLVLVYITFAFLLNTTHIEARVDALTVRHGPMPWAGNRRLDPTRISQLYVEHYVLHTKNGHPQHRYRVWAEMVDGKRKKLVSGLHEREQARFIEQELEKALGIQDRPVAGEVGV